MLMLMTCPSCKPSQDQQTKPLDDDLSTDQSKDQDTAIPVEVAKMIKGPIRNSVKSVAVLMPQDKASVRSLISGVIKDIYVQEGDQVKAQQRLVKISRPGAKSLIQKAVSTYQKSRRDVKKVQRLVTKGLAPKDELVQAKFNRDQSALELNRLRDEAKNEKVLAPINGVIVSRSIYRGETVSPGQAMFELMDLSTVYAPLNLPDRWSTKIRKGMKANIFDREGQLLCEEATVSYVSPIIDANTGTFNVWVSPQQSTLSSKNSSKDTQSTQPSLKPGLFVTVEITLDQKSEALLLPKAALIYKDGRPMVATIINQRVKLVDIKVGYTEQSKVEVIAGLNPHDLVITFGHRGLETGTLVKAIWPSAQQEPPSTADTIESSLKR